ncbi:MAG: DNA/RNA non-specific endonuclease [Muribaculaceae bacterium]
MNKRKNTHLKQLQRRASEAKRRFTLIAWLAVIAVIAIAIGRHLVQDKLFADNMPTNTALQQLQQIAVPDSIPNEVISYKAHTVYFNPVTHQPNATVYELTAEETEGDEPRTNNFIHDENVPQCAHAWDYSNSGYDRGHMTPAADMKWDAEAMQQSFFMTNICPQDHSLNSGAWSKLEKKVRSWAQRDSSLIVISGPIHTANEQTIGKEMEIPVPQAFFKVIYATRQQRAIAFIYPNQSCGKKMQKYVATVRDVEHATGLNFFAILPTQQQDQIEQNSNLTQWELNTPQQ